MEKFHTHDEEIVGNDPTDHRIASPSMVYSYTIQRPQQQRPFAVSNASSSSKFFSTAKYISLVDDAAHAQSSSNKWMFRSLQVQHSTRGGAMDPPYAFFSEEVPSSSHNGIRRSSPQTSSLKKQNDSGKVNDGGIPTTGQQQLRQPTKPQFVLSRPSSRGTFSDPLHHFYNDVDPVDNNGSSTTPPSTSLHPFLTRQSQPIFHPPQPPLSSNLKEDSRDGVKRVQHPVRKSRGNLHSAVEGTTTSKVITTQQKRRKHSHKKTRAVDTTSPSRKHPQWSIASRVHHDGDQPRYTSVVSIVDPKPCVVRGRNNKIDHSSSNMSHHPHQQGEEEDIDVKYGIEMNNPIHVTFCECLGVKFEFFS